MLQVNGKMRGTVEVAVGIDQAGAVAAAMELANVQKQTEVSNRRGGGYISHAYEIRGRGCSVHRPGSCYPMALSWPTCKKLTGVI